MENGFDLDYCRRIATQKRDRNREIAKNRDQVRDLRGMNIYLIDKKTNKPCDLSVLAGQVVSASATDISQLLIENKIEDAAYYDRQCRIDIEEMLLEDFLTETDEDGWVYMTAETIKGLRFRYAPIPAIAYIAKQLRDAVREIMNGTHGFTDRLPMWHGEKTPNELRETVKKYHGNEPFAVPLGGNIPTMDIKTPITFKKVQVKRQAADGDFKLVFETHAYYTVNGKRLIRTPIGDHIRNRTDRKLTAAEAMKLSDKLMTNVAMQTATHARQKKIRTLSKGGCRISRR